MQSGQVGTFLFHFSFYTKENRTNVPLRMIIKVTSTSWHTYHELKQIINLLFAIVYEIRFLIILFFYTHFFWFCKNETFEDVKAKHLCVGEPISSEIFISVWKVESYQSHKLLMLTFVSVFFNDSDYYRFFFQKNQ